MKQNVSISEREAIRIAVKVLEREGWLDRVLVKNVHTMFLNRAESAAMYKAAWPDREDAREPDKWFVNFPLVEPIKEMDVVERYVVVNAETGEAHLGLL